MGTIFLESGGDATQDFSFWSSTAGTVAIDSTVSFTGPCSIKVMANGANGSVTKNAVMADAGRRLSFRFRGDNTVTSGNGGILLIATSGGTAIFNIQLTTAMVLRLQPVGATVVLGTKVLALNTWYRITVSYTITNTTTFKFAVFIDGVLEATATAGTLTNVGTDQLLFRAANGNYTGAANNWFDDIYLDDGTDYLDPGNIRVTAKRPNANGTTNGFTTQIGSGSSGYGSGHSPQVNERPLSTTNGWSMIGAGGAVTEEYNVEGQATGDISVAGATLVDFMGWVYASSALSETGSIVLVGAASNISLTSSNTMFTKFAGSTTYPPGTGADIGIVTSTTVTTVSLYECGIVVAYKPDPTQGIENVMHNLNQVQPNTIIFG